METLILSGSYPRTDFILYHTTFRGKRENKMKKFRIFPLILLLALLFSLTAPAALALEDPGLNAQAAILVDLDSGIILYEKNMSQQRSPASLTKVMTVLLTLEAVDLGKVSLDDVVTAGMDCQNGMSDDSSSVYIVAGEQMTLRDLVYCAAVASGNDACNVIASYVGGSIESFVDSMNQKAAALGCASTHFVDPNGLSSEDVTSAYDLYLITRDAMRYGSFLEICNTVSYTVPATNANAARELKNSNALIGTEGIYGAGYLYEYAKGVKTGYTRAAGYCLISTAEKDGVRLLGIVMGCDGPYNASIDELKNFSDSVKLYNWAFDNFSYRKVLSVSDVVEKANVALAQGDGTVPLRPQRDVSLLLPNDMELSADDIRITLFDDQLTAPVEVGTALGEAHIYLNGAEMTSVRLLAAANVELARGEYLKQRLNAVLSNTWVVVMLAVILVLAIAYLALVTRYRRLRRKHLRQRRLAEQRRRELERQRQEAEGEGKLFDEDLF